jgi:hypothetical protein
MAPTKHDIAVTKAADITAAQDQELMALLGETAGEGLENISADDIKVPRLAILQPTSPLAGDLGIGAIANLQTSTSYGKEVDVIPLFFWTSRTQWASKVLGSPIECRSLDGIRGTNTDERHAGGNCATCPLAQWQDRTPPVCTSFKNLLFLPLGPGETLAERVLAATPAVFGAKRTAQRNTNELLTMASMLRVGGKPAPLYMGVYKLKTEKVNGEAGTYFVPKFSRTYVLKEEDITTFKYLRQLYIDMKEISTKIADQASTQDDGEGSGEFHRAEVVESDAF